MRVKFEGLSLFPHDPDHAKALLSDLGALRWSERREPSGMNVSLTQDIADIKVLEVEVQTDNETWRIHPTICLDVSCSKDQIDKVVELFEKHGIVVKDDTITHSHRAVAFESWRVLGADVRVTCEL